MDTKSTTDWEFLSKFLGFLISLTTIWAIFKLWIRPAMRSWVFSILDDEKDGHPRLIAINREIYKDRVGKTDRYFDKTDDHESKLMQLDLTTKALQIQLTETKAHADRVPDLIRVLTEIKEGNESFAEKFEKGMRIFGEEITKVRESVARIEGAWNGIDRRA